MNADVIHYDFTTGKFTGAGFIERIGLEIMRMGAHVASRINFTGLSLGVKLVSSVLPSKRIIRTKFEDDQLFDFPYGDGYWSVLFCNKKTYCPELEPYLKAFKDVNYAFIDCGSNYGYMSVLISSPSYGSKKVIAIEADSINFERTVGNSKINDDRYEYRHNAIFSKSGETVTLFGAKHEARSILAEVGGGEHGQVETLALNDLAGWVKMSKAEATILKLDVEGVEIEALKGAAKLLKGDCLVIYEDHGSDREHSVSRYLKEELGMRIYAGNKNGRSIKEIKSIAELDDLKTNLREGYDFFAENSELWRNRVNNVSGEA